MCMPLLNYTMQEQLVEKCTTRLREKLHCPTLFSNKLSGTQVGLARVVAHSPMDDLGPHKNRYNANTRHPKFVRPATSNLTKGYLISVFDLTILKHIRFGEFSKEPRKLNDIKASID
jgi:hypothetical protein